MRLKELIFQRTDSGELKKFLFTQDYNLIEATKNGLHPGAFRSIFNAAIYPAYSPNDKELGLEGDSGKIRLGITFSHDNVIYRFVRDISGKAVSLSKFEDASSKFIEISSDRNFIKNAFENSFRIPQNSLFERLCMVEPSAMIEDFNRWKDKVRESETSYFDNLDQDAGVKKKIKKLRELEAEKKNIDFVSDCEFEVDGLQSKLFTISDKLTKIRSKEEDLSIIEGELAEYRKLEEVEFPEGIEERLKGYEKLKEKKDADLLRLDNRMEDLLNKLSSLKVEPIHKDKILVTTSVMAITSFALALFIPKLLAPFLILFFACLGTVAWRVILFIRRKESEESLNSKMKELGEDKSVISKKFDIETSVVKKFIGQVGARDADDALDIIKRKKQLDSNYSAAKKEIDEYKQKMEFDRIKGEKEKIEKEIKDIEERMRQIPPASMDPNDLNNAVDDLRTEIGDENLAKHSANDAPPSSKDPYRFLINSTAKHLKVEPDKLIEALKSTYTVNLQILSGKYFKQVNWGKDGIASFRTEGGNSEVAPSELKGDEELLAYFALQFTLMQIVSKYQPIPSVIFGRFDAKNPEMKKETFFRAITHLSKTTQILHVF